jgi:DNA repair protein RadC
VTSRRYTDRCRPGAKLGNWIEDYFKWYFFGASVETVVIALFDKNKKLITTQKISEGTVNTSEIIPRRAMEAATKAKAAYAIMAHNHPGGTCEASTSDVHATMVVDKALESISVELLQHYVVAGMGVGAVEIPKDV